MSFQNNLRQLRLKNNLTQEDVAQKIGVTVRTYQSYEIDGRFPRRQDTIPKLTQVLNCNVEDLLSSDTLHVAEESAHYNTDSHSTAQKLAQDLSNILSKGILSEKSSDNIMKQIQNAYWTGKERRQLHNSNITPSS